VSGRVRPETVFERVASPQDLALVLEILDSGRTRIAADDLPTPVPGVAFVLAPFRVPRTSRFSDGSFGVLYAANRERVARAEYGFHLCRFLAATAEPPQSFTLYRLSLEIRGRQFADLRPDAAALADVMESEPARYGRAQALGAELREQSAEGVVFPSVRSPGGTCVGVFRPRCVTRCERTARLYVEWTGTRLDGWAEVRLA
jgi:hypothetical protein